MYEQIALKNKKNMDDVYDKMFTKTANTKVSVVISQMQLHERFEPSMVTFFSASTWNDWRRTLMEPLCLGATENVMCAAPAHEFRSCLCCMHPH